MLDQLPGHQLDLQILGIGEDAHIEMNKPNRELQLNVHAEQRGSVRYAAMGVRDILCAKRILLISNGENKAQAVSDMFHHQLTTDIPATLLQLHPDMTVILDRGASSKLENL